MHVGGVDGAGPAGQHGWGVLHPPEHPAEPVRVLVGVAQRGDELVEGRGEPVLEVFLPGGGDLPGQLAGGVEQVHVGEGQVGQRGVDLVAGGRAEQLLGDDHRPVPVAGLLDHRCPGPGGARVLVALEPGLAQVERGVHVRTEGVTGVEHPGVTQRVPVLPQHPLQERGAGLRRPDVEEHHRPARQHSTGPVLTH